MNDNRRRQLVRQMLISWHRWWKSGGDRSSPHWERFEELTWELASFERHNGLLVGSRYDSLVPYGAKEKGNQP